MGGWGTGEERIASGVRVAVVGCGGDGGWEGMRTAENLFVAIYTACSRVTNCVYASLVCFSFL